MQMASNTYDRLYGDLATLHSNQFGVLFNSNWQMPARKTKEKNGGRGGEASTPPAPFQVLPLLTHILHFSHLA